MKIIIITVDNDVTIYQYLSKCSFDGFRKCVILGYSKTYLWCLRDDMKLIIQVDWYVANQWFLLRSCSMENNLTTLGPRYIGRHFANDNFKHIFLNKNVRVLIKISLKFVSKGPINNHPALVQIMAWRRPGDQPLFEPMVVRLPTHVCVTRPQWVNSSTQLVVRAI